MESVISKSNERSFMRIFFFLIDMNLGGTEKSLLNLIDTLPESTDITIMMMREHGELLSAIPAHVRVQVIDHSKDVCHAVESNFVTLAKEQLGKGRLLSAFRAMLYYMRSKMQKGTDLYYKFMKHSLPSQQEAYDVAVAYAGPNTFISNYVLDKVSATQKIQWVHFDVNKIYFDVSINRNLFHQFDKIVCVSEDVQGHLLKKIPELAAKTAVRYNVIPYQTIDTLSNEAATAMDLVRNNKIVTVGRLTEEKGHMGFLSTFRKLKDAGLDFVWYIVGDGNCRQELEAKIQELKLESHVILLGKQMNPYPYMKQADIYLQPSRYEGHCVTILEAKYLHKAIVCTDFSGAREELQDMRTGLITSFEDADKLEKMTRIITDTALRSHFEVALQEEQVQQSSEKVPPFWQ
jgi:glycosyltransferase involved in cell wall biosynthesis